MSDPDEIFLQPACCADPEVGRLWCEDDSPEDCDDDSPWVRYIHVDKHAELMAEVEALRKAAAAPRTEPVALTDEQIDKISNGVNGIQRQLSQRESRREFARAILAAAIPPGHVVVPMTNAEIAECKKRATLHSTCGRFIPYLDETMFARAIEAHRGIGAARQGEKE